jgi:hypothetical protein
MPQSSLPRHTVRSVAWSLLFLSLAACPGRTIPASTGAGGSTTDPSPQLPHFPVLGFIPPEVSFLVVGRQVAATTEGLRAFLEPFQELDRGLTPARIDRELRREIGVGLLDSGDLTDAGFDPTGDIAVFSDGRSISFALPVANDQRLRAFLDTQTRTMTTHVRTYRGLLVTSWKQGWRGRGAFTRLDRYLLINLVEGKALEPKGAAADKKEAADKLPWRAAPHAWLDAILAARAARRTVTGAKPLQRAIAALPPGQDLIGFVDVRAMNQALNGWTRRDKHSCSGLDRDLELVRRVVAGIKLRRRAARGTLVVDLASPASEGLKRATAAGPVLPAKLRHQAPLCGSWHVDPAYLAGLVERLGRRRCGALFELVRELRWLARVVRRRRVALAHLGGRGIAAAVIAAGRSGAGVDVRAGLAAPCPDEAARRYFTSQLPLETGGPTMTKGRSIHRVTTARPLHASPRLCLDDGMMRLTSGQGVMALMLEPAPKPSPGRLFSLRLEPGRIADVRALLRLLEDPPATTAASGRSTRSYRDLDRLALTISRYARARIEGMVKPGGLRVEVEYSLR